MENEKKLLSEEDIVKALETNSDEAKSTIDDEDKFEKLIQRLEKKLKLIPRVGEYVSDIASLVSLVRSYIKKEYTDIPLGVIISIVSTLIYIVSPFDLLHDAIPVIGYVDDLILLGFVLKMIHSDVDEYRNWRVKNGKELMVEA